MAQIKTPGRKWPGVGGCSPWKVPRPPAGSGCDLATRRHQETRQQGPGQLGCRMPSRVGLAGRTQARRGLGGGRCPRGPLEGAACPRGRAPLCPLWGATCRPPRRQGRGGTAMRGRREGPGTAVAGREMGRGWRAASWRVRRGPVQTPAPRDLDMELRSAPGASVSSPVKWGQRHLPGRDRTRALSATQARKGSETAQLLPFRSGQPVDASSGKPS